MAETPSLPKIRLSDLTDPTLDRLNRTFSTLAEQVAAVQGVTGPFRFSSEMSGPAFYATVRIPTRDDELLTFGAAKQLFDPNAIRDALLKGLFLGGPVNPLPIPPGGPGGASTIIEASDYCGGLGLSEACINAAIDAAPAGGAAIHCRAGTWNFNGPVRMNKANITLYGDGEATVFLRNVAVTFDEGMVVMTESNCSITNLVIDGQISSSTDIDYSVLFGAMGGDPMHPDLTNNSSVWVKNGVSDINFSYIKIRQSGGYAILLDCMDADLNRITIDHCVFEDNVAITYSGTVGPDTYLGCGSWTGGIFYKGGGGNDYLGNPHGDFHINDLTVTNCSFRNITGNCIWGHAYATSNLHTNVTKNNNTFRDLGRDGILFGAVSGGSCVGNTFHRVGYVGGVPAYFPGQNAVAIDMSGYVRGVKIIGNTMISVNGGCIDLDGFSEGEVVGNTMLVPEATDYLYTEDQVADYGYVATVPPLALKNLTYGIQSNSTFDAEGGKRVLVSGNTIKNMGKGSVIMFNAEEWLVTGNNIRQLASATYPPIILATNGASAPYFPPRYCRNNVVTRNRIDYDAAGGNYCIAEIDDLTGPSQPVDGPNFVSDNQILGSNKGEFLPSAGGLSGGSRTSSQLYTNGGLVGTALSDLNKTITQREGVGTTGVTRWYRNNLATNVSTALMSLADEGPILNVSLNGAVKTGSFVTGARSVFGPFVDFLYTGKAVLDGFLVAGRYGADTAFYDSEADVLTDDYGLIRYVRAGALGTGGEFQQSISTLAGVRVWTAFGTSGSVSLTGWPAQIAINDQYLTVTTAATFRLPPDVFVGKAGGYSGTVDTSGTAVTWVSGDRFDVLWAAGQPIVINGVAYAIASLTDNENLTLSSSAGVQAGVAYTSNDGSLRVGAEISTAIYALNGGVVGQAVAALGSASGYAEVYNGVEAIEGGVAGRGLVITGKTTAGSKGGYLQMGDIAVANPTALVGDSSFGTLAHSFFSSTGSKVWYFKSKDGVFAFDGQSADTAAGLKVGKFTNAAGSRSANIDFHTDPTYTDYGLRLLRNGGANGAALLSNRGTGGITIENPEAASFFIKTNNLTRFTIDSAGLVTIGVSVQIDQLGALSASGVISSTGAAGGVNVILQDTYNAIQAAAGGVFARSIHADKYMFSGVSNGVPTGTTGDTFPQDGQFYYDTGLAKFRAHENGSWVNMIGGGGGSPGGASTNIQFNNSGSFGGSANFTWNNATRQMAIDGVDGAAALTIVNGYVYSDQGFAVNPAESASTAISALGGGVTALSLISIRNDGAGGLTLSRTSATARDYSLGVGASGFLFIRDVTAGSLDRLTIDSSGTVSIGGSNVQINQVGAISLSGVLSSTGASGGVAVTTQAAYNGIQIPSGGVYGRSLRATTYAQLGNNAGVPSVTSGDTFVAGAAFWNTTTGVFQMYNGSTWVIIGGAGAGVTSINSMLGPSISIVGTTNQVNVANATNTVTLSLPQNIHTAAQPTFNAMALTNTADNTLDMYTSGSDASCGGGIQCRAIAVFQAVANAIEAVNGGIKAGTVVNAVTGLQIAGSTVVDGSRNASFVNLTTTGNITFGGAAALIQGATTRIDGSGNITGVIVGSSNTGASTTFRNNNGNFTVNGNGDITSAGFINMTGVNPYRVGGVTIVDGSRNSSFVSETLSGAGQALTLSSGYVFAAQGYFTSVASDESFKSTFGGIACRSVSIYTSAGGGAYTTIIDSSKNVRGNSFKSLAGTDWINSSGQFVGNGVAVGASGIGGAGFNYWNGSSYEFGATGVINVGSVSTITVRGGIITAWA